MSSIMPHNGLPFQVLPVERGSYILDASAQMAAIIRQIGLLETLRAEYIAGNKTDLIAVADSQIAQLRITATELTTHVNEVAQ